jgi:hypothetical protein
VGEEDLVGEQDYYFAVFLDAGLDWGMEYIQHSLRLYLMILYV